MSAYSIEFWEEENEPFRVEKRLDLLLKRSQRVTEELCGGGIDLTWVHREHQAVALQKENQCGNHIFQISAEKQPDCIFK